MSAGAEDRSGDMATIELPCRDDVEECQKSADLGREEELLVEYYVRIDVSGQVGEEDQD